MIGPQGELVWLSSAVKNIGTQGVRELLFYYFFMVTLAKTIENSIRVLQRSPFSS